MEAPALSRYSQEIEAALYFCVLEALQNVAKYAHASAARVTLGHDGQHLTFTVTDDGTGFDQTTTAMGTGLQGMRTGWPRSAAPSTSPRSPATAPR